MKKGKKIGLTVLAVVVVLWAAGAFVETPAADRGPALIKALGLLTFVVAIAVIGGLVTAHRRKRATVPVRNED